MIDPRTCRVLLGHSQALFLCFSERCVKTKQTGRANLKHAFTVFHGENKKRTVMWFENQINKIEKKREISNQKDQESISSKENKMIITKNMQCCQFRVFLRVRLRISKNYFRESKSFHLFEDSKEILLSEIIF